MGTIISVHSFRGGTGKSNTTANLATLLAAQGSRIGVVDTDIQSPGIHILFSLDEDRAQYSLNDYLWGRCNIEQTAHDVTENLGGPVAGRIVLIPSSIKVQEIARVLRDGYDVGLLNDGYKRLIKNLKLDLLLIDTHPGLNEETLLSIAVSDLLIVLMRPDYQDYEGTGVTIEVARKLGVPRLMLLVNKVPESIDLESVKTRVGATYGADVAAVLPHSEELMTLGSKGMFVLKYPNHPITRELRRIAEGLLRLDAVRSRAADDAQPHPV